MSTLYFVVGPYIFIGLYASIIGLYIYVIGLYVRFIGLCMYI